MNFARSIVVLATCSFVAGCAASSKTFYADAKKVNDNQLCRTLFDAQQNGDRQFEYDLAREGERRGLTREQCETKVATENGVILTAALVTTVVGVAIACEKGCSAPSGGGAYRPNYAGYSDVDCRGGSGNGPLYTDQYGPFPINPYNDPYNLDADNDGMACEVGEGGWGT